VPNGLITLIVVVVALVLSGTFLTVRYGPPKDARRREVKAARARELRARRALRQVRDQLSEVPPGALDIVGTELRRAALDVINDYEAKELEIKD
jgi:type II secretory pathway pseudopilin PulG